MTSSSQWNRIAVIVDLVEKAPATSPLGRTVLMKCLYFLKTLRDVPVDYRFGLYNYGPFDSDVLEDLRYAKSLGAVNITLSVYPNGYGYQCRPGDEAESIKARGMSFLKKYNDDIDWVMSRFGGRSASSLEICSTIIYIDRALYKKQMSASAEEMASKIMEIKPHLKEEVIYEEIQNLKGDNLLKSL